MATSVPFEWQIRVYYEDTDAQTVVYYANYFRYMERARTEWLRALGVDQVAMMKNERRIFVVTETQAKFLAPAKLSDVVSVTAKLSGLTRATFEIEQNIYRDNLDGELLVSGSVKAAYLDADTMKPKKLPPIFLEEKAS